jgi:hypothetical protein
MDAKQFIFKVDEMRKAQKDYFKKRDSYCLATAKRLEKEVDDQLVVLIEEIQCGPRLF